jgi:hypothetical protein
MIIMTWIMRLIRKDSTKDKERFRRESWYKVKEYLSSKFRTYNEIADGTFYSHLKLLGSYERGNRENAIL